MYRCTCKQYCGVTCIIVIIIVTHACVNNQMSVTGETIVTTQRLLELLGSCLLHCKPKVRL